MHSPHIVPDLVVAPWYFTLGHLRPQEALPNRSAFGTGANDSNVRASTTRDVSGVPDLHPPLVYVEDSPEDYEAVRRSLRAIGFTGELHHYATGDDVLDYYAALLDAKKPLPRLLVLDLNLPGTDGRDVLVELRAHEQLRDLPVIILTTSQNPTDISHCQQLNVLSYLTKPVDLAELRTKLRHILAFIEAGDPPPSFA